MPSTSLRPRAWAAGALLGLCCHGAPSWAATYAVTTTAQLQNAVSSANANPGPDVINVAAGEYSPTTLVVTDDLTVNGGARPGTLISSAAGDDVFRIDAGSATFNDIEILYAVNGSGISFGSSSGVLRMNRSTVARGSVGVWLASGSGEIGNCTFTRNYTGIEYESNASLTLRNDTILENDHSGLEHHGHFATVLNTIIAGNGIVDCTHHPEVSSNNLDSDGSGGPGFITAPQQVDVLGDWGGPIETCQLMPTSPAIDAGASCEAVDQRGTPRPQGGTCDIGAFERTPFVFDFDTDVVGAGGSVSTDYEEDGANPADPIETTVTHPDGGAISIEEGPGAAVGIGFLGQRVHIDVSPSATPANPLMIEFLIDSSLVIAGQSAATIVVMKDGVVVPPCTGAPGTASPDACVANRQTVAGHDVKITVLSSTASLWDFKVGTLEAVESTTPRVALSVSPNPIRNSALVRFSLEAAQRVDLSLYDVAGRKLADLISGMRGPGEQSATLDARGLGAGVYFLRLRTMGATWSKPVVLMK